MRNGARRKDALVTLVHPLPGMRGPARTFLALARYLADRWSIKVAVPEGFVSRELEASHPDVPVIHLPLSESRGASWAGGVRVLHEALRETDQRVLIHANGLSGLNLVAPVALRLRALVLVHYHDFRMLPRSRAHLAVWRRLGTRMRFFPVSDFSRGLLEGTSIRDLVGGVLPNPIDCATFRSSRDGPRRPFRVGFVGSKAPRKGLHRLIRIAHHLRDEDVEWCVYGISSTIRSPYVDRCRDTLRELGLDDKVRWLGATEDVSDAYEGVDALLVPSDDRGESFSRVAIEGMASGLPLVATRIQGLSEVVWDGVSGLLFDPHHPEEGAEKLRQVIQSPDLRKALSTGAERAAFRFDLSTVGGMLEGFYEDLLAGRDRSPAGRSSS